VGKKNYPARLVYHLPGRLSRLCLTQNIFLIAALFVFYGLYQGIFRAVGKAFASDFVPEHLRASGVGWYSTTVGLLQLVASVVAGMLWDRIGHAAVFYYGAVFAVVGSIGLLLLIRGKEGATLRRGGPVAKRLKSGRFRIRVKSCHKGIGRSVGSPVA